MRAEFRERDGTAVAERLLAGDFTADALVCGNDELALAVMARLTDGGVAVPEDIAIVGWDDVMTARYVRPGLTTVRQPVQQLGALAADRLHDLVSGAAPSAERRVLATAGGDPQQLRVPTRPHRRLATGHRRLARHPS